jgi:hypothetical protein
MPAVPVATTVTSGYHLERLMNNITKYGVPELPDYNLEKAWFGTMGVKKNCDCGVCRCTCDSVVAPSSLALGFNILLTATACIEAALGLTAMHSGLEVFRES